MKKSIGLWQFSGFAAVSLLGTLLHFIYDWSGQSILIAPFSGVNESTWEHMKLLYFPLLIFAIIQNCFFLDVKSFWCIKIIGTFTGLISIPTIFYTLNGAFGKTPDFLNITIFFVSAAIAFHVETYLFKKEKTFCSLPKTALLLLISIGALFVIFTFYPPQIPIFQDPIGGFYGIE